jgi:hypothetical protein
MHILNKNYLVMSDNFWQTNKVDESQSIVFPINEFDIL